jgi:hypothetical protein
MKGQQMRSHTLTSAGSESMGIGGIGSSHASMGTRALGSHCRSVRKLRRINGRKRYGNGVSVRVNIGGRTTSGCDRRVGSAFKGELGFHSGIASGGIGLIALDTTCSILQRTVTTEGAQIRFDFAENVDELNYLATICPEGGDGNLARIFPIAVYRSALGWTDQNTTISELGTYRRMLRLLFELCMHACFHRVRV